MTQEHRLTDANPAPSPDGDDLARATTEAPTGQDVRSHLPILFLTRSTINTSFRIIYPFLPSIARGLGISLTAATQLTALRMFGGLGAPFLGLLADRHSRRRVMEAGLALFALASLLLIAGGTFTAAAIAFALYGVAKALYDPAVHAYVGDAVPYHERSRAVGILELSWSSGWLIGVPLSGFLIERLGWRAPWGVLLALGLFSVGLTRVALPSAPPPAARTGERRGVASMVAAWRDLLRRRSVAAMLLTSLLLTLAIEIPFVMYGAWLETTFALSFTKLGVASIVVGAAEATAEFGSAMITDRLGKRRSVLVGLLGLATGLVALPWLARFGLAPALAGVALMILLFEFGIVSLLPMATELAPDARATLFSLTVMALNLGRILGAWIGGWLWQWESIGIHAGAGTACALAGALVLARGMREIE